MKNGILYLVVLILFGLSQNCIAQEKKYVLLISIDGLRPDFYLEDTWNTPILKGLKENGVYSKGINSVFPSVTYPSHTTLVTGSFPATHGVLYNSPRNAEDANHWYWEFSRIQTSTLWQAAQDKGLETGAVMWPVTVGAPITYNFPVRRPYGKEKGNQLSVTEPVVTPPTLMPRLKKEGIITSQSQFEHDAVDGTIGAMATYIIEQHTPALMAVHFINVDHMQHVYGRDDEHVKQAIENVDMQIGKLINALKYKGIYDQTDIIVTGDHGHVDVNKVFLPNLPLKKAGLITDNKEKAHFVTAGGAAFLYVQDKKYGAQVKKILASLPAKQRDVFTIYNKKQLDEIGADPEAYLAIGMKKGYVANQKTTGSIIQNKKPVAAHGFYPSFKEIQTGFIMSGPDVAAHGEIKTAMGIQDIAPIISKLLDLGFKSKNGKLHKEFLK